MNSKKIIAYQGSSGSYSEELLKKEYPDNLDYAKAGSILKELLNK